MREIHLLWVVHLDPAHLPPGWRSAGRRRRPVRRRIRRSEPLHLGQVDAPFLRLSDLEHEQAPGAEHAGVDVLPAHAVEEVLAAVGRLEVGSPMTSCTETWYIFPVPPQRGSPCPGRPGRATWSAVLARILAISTVDEQRGDAQLHIGRTGCRSRHHLRGLEADLLAGLGLDRASDLLVELRLDQFGLVLAEPRTRPAPRAPG